MRARGGRKLAHTSDASLANILKSWGFKAKRLSGGDRGWEAPDLATLREAILAKYPAVEFDDCPKWGLGEYAQWEVDVSKPRGRSTAADTAEPVAVDAVIVDTINASEMNTLPGEPEGSERDETAMVKQVPCDATRGQDKAATVKQTKPRTSPWPGNKPRPW